MKKSTILLVSALVFFLGSLTAFNFAMKAEYETGNYKDPFHNFVKQDFTGFDAVEVNGGSKIAVKIVQGPFKVMMHNRVQDFVQMKQQGNKLIVDVDLKDGKGWSNGRHVVYISCPNLSALTTTTRFKSSGKEEKELYVNNPYDSKIITLEGIEQESLYLLQDHASAVKLVKTKINNLQAVMGITAGSGSKLFIGKDNQINAATLDIRNKSMLYMKDVVIPSLSYQFSDSASAEFTGTSLKLLSQR